MPLPDTPSNYLMRWADLLHHSESRIVCQQLQFHDPHNRWEQSDFYTRSSSDRPQVSVWPHECDKNLYCCTQSQQSPLSPAYSKQLLHLSLPMVRDVVLRTQSYKSPTLAACIAMNSLLLAVVLAVFEPANTQPQMQRWRSRQPQSKTTRIEGKTEHDNSGNLFGKGCWKNC